LALLAGLFSEDCPVHIGAEFLALDSGEGFDVGAYLGWCFFIAPNPARNTGLRYWLALVAAWELPGQGTLAASNLYSTHQSVNRCYLIHDLNITLVDLQDNPC
jgi:hypothetical protein